MSGRDNNAKIYIEAVLENLSSFAKDFKSGIEKIDTTIPIKIDDDDVANNIKALFEKVFNVLGNSKGFAKQLDLSNLFPQMINILQSDLPDSRKLELFQPFAESIISFEDLARRSTEEFGNDSKKIASYINNINSSLGAEKIVTYLTELQKVYDLINHLKMPSSYKENLLNSFIDSLQVGVNANNLGDAIGLSKIADQFEDVDRFALSAKVAREKLFEELEAWDNLKAGSKARAGTRRVEDIQGYISRIEALSGKRITEYLQDKINDEQTTAATRKQLKSILTLYNKDGGWAEYFEKWSNSDSENVKQYSNRLIQTNQRVKEMTRRQLEERQKALEENGLFKASMITQGTTPSATIKYDEEVEATEELNKQEAYRRQIADEIAQEVNELREKVNLLKELAGLEKQVITSGVESSTEYQEMQALQDMLDEVTRKVNEKTTAFKEEQGVVANVVKSELEDLQKIQDKLDEIAGFNDNEKTTNQKKTKTSKPRQNLEKLAEEKKRQAEEAQATAAEEVRKNSILGEVRENKNNKTDENKPKTGAVLKNRKLRDVPSLDKTANEREAQAIKEIRENAEDATIGLQKFGDTNSQIAQNVTTVADALKKEATALNSIIKAISKAEESKVFQQVRKDTLQNNLSNVHEKIDLSKKEIETLQKGSNITVFDNNRLEEASSQLRSAYKDVISFREVYSKDNSHENMVEMAKREIKLWKAYKEAEKQGIADSDLEAKRLNPINLGIDANKNADNVGILGEELTRRKQVYEDYLKQATSIRKELEEIENPPSKKNLEIKDNVIKDYQEAIEIIKEYIQTQKTLTEAQQNTTSEASEVLFAPEQLEQFNIAMDNISNSLNNIQTALGTLDDKSDIPSITQSVKDMADALKELSSALGEIKQKDFNLNIGLPNNNPIGQQGEAKRKILKELEQQYNELNSYFVNKYGGDSEAVNTLRNYEGGNKYVYSLMEDYPIASDKGESLNNRIEAYKTLVEQLRSFLIQEGDELNKVVSNVLSPEEIIKKINEDVANFNPTTALQSIFEDMKISIDASLAQINTESKGFSFLSGSAEEAAEAKRKFVEANKDVLQSIVASMPKIEQEADALEKIEDIKEESKSNADIKNNNKENENTIKQQKNLLDQQQPSLQQIEEAQLKEQQKIQQKVQEQLREEVYDDYSKPQHPQYDFEPDYEDLARQAQEARQYYQEQISNDFEVKVETQLDLKQDETGQLSLFDNILPEKDWGQEVETKTNNISEAAIKGQISFQQLQEAIENSERAFAKLSSSKNTSGKSFLQNTDIPNDVLEKYENISTTLGKGYKATGNLQELKNLSDELTDVKTELKASFDETGNLKSTVDPFEVQNLLSKYDELINKIQNLKAVISSPTSEENIALKIAKDAEKAQQELDKLRAKAQQELDKLRVSINQKFEKGTYDNVGRKADEVINKYGFRDDNNELISSFTVEQTLNKDAGNQQRMIEALNSSLLEFEKRKENLRSLKDDPLIDADQLKQASKEVDNIKYKIEQLEKDIRANGDKMASTGSVNKFTSQVEQFMIKNPRITGEARAQLQSYMDTLNSGASVSVQSLNSMQQGFNRVFNEQLQAGNLGTNIWSQMLGKIREGAAFLLTKFSFYEVFNQFRQGIEIVHQFDDALTEMMKVSDETRSSLEAYQKTTFNTADAIGTSALQLQNSTADFMRLGETLNQAAESAKTANVLMNVSEFQSIDEATKSLIAMGAAYDDLSKMNIVDKLNEVGNNYSISTSGAAEALQASASALKTAGNDMDEALALVTAGNQIVQDVSKAGNGLRTIALRLTGKQMCPNIE